MPTLVVRHPDGSETEHELSGELRIGRQDGNDLILTEGGVSRQHARLLVEGGQVLLEDLGSANGTYVDEERISEPTPLTPQSQVLLGDYTLKLKGGGRAAGGARRPAPRASSPDVGSEEEAPRATRAMPSVKPARPAGAALARRERPARGAAPAPAGVPVLRGLTGPWANKTYPLKSKLVVGRAPPAAVLIEDDSISRKHAEVERNAQGSVFVRDLGSANGTLLNGERIGQEPVEVFSGDIMQFGMVEVAYESGEQASGVPVRRGGAAPARGRGDASDAPPARKSRKLLVVAGVLVGLMLALGIASKLVVPPEPVPVAPDPAAAQANTQQQLQDLLNQCRSFASMEMGNEPQWDKADAACEQAINIDPINTEANTLIKRIKLEKEAAEYYTQGTKMLQRLKEDDALDLLRKIPKESQYFRRAKIKVDEAMEQVKKRSLDDCKRYLADSQWSAAVPRCDRYMGFWCQGVSREELEPPLGFSISLEGRIGKKQWRPKDKLFVQFLLARKRVDPNMEPWKCPVTDFGAKEVVEGPEGQVKKMFKDRYPNPYMNAAMFDYWGGRGNESLAKLQKVRSNLEQASLHGQVDLLIQDVSTVDQLFKTGSSALQADDVEKAAESFDEALELDKRIMGEMWERAPSFYRRNIQQDIAEKAFNRGKDWAKREDPLRACKIWKIGFRFYKGNTDLIRVLSNVCSMQGTRLFSSARACPDLAQVLEWAVPGDGLEEKVAKKKEELKCQ